MIDKAIEQVKSIATPSQAELIMKGATDFLFGAVVQRALKTDQEQAADAVKIATDAALNQIRTKINETQIRYVSDVTSAGADTLQIGDLVFAMPTALPPPSAISVSKQYQNYNWQTLRTVSSQRVTSGHAHEQISMNLWFVGADAINFGLRRLMATFNCMPFVYVENSFVRASIAPGSLETMIFSLVNLTIRTVPMLPDTMVADVGLLSFNYKPYTGDFWYRRTWKTPEGDNPFNNLADTGTVSERLLRESTGIVPPPNDISKVLGEQYRLYDDLELTTPVTNPLQSEPYRDWITRHMNKLGTIAEGPQHRTEFQYREFAAVDVPPKDTTISGRVIQDGRLRGLDMTYLIDNGADCRMYPPAAEAVEKLARWYATEYSGNKNHEKLRVNSCFRTAMEQEKFKKAGRGPEESWHEAGAAIDLGLGKEDTAVWLAVTDKAKELGLPNAGRHKYNVQTPIDPKTGKPIANSETWHYSYAAAVKQYGSPTKMIAALYSSSAEPTQEDINKSNAYIEAMRRLLGQYLDNGWDPLAEYSTSMQVILARPNTFSITEDDPNFVIQGIAISKSNIIAELPVMSYEHGTQQFLGSTDMEAVIELFVIGDNNVRRLQQMLETVQASTRSIRRIRDAAAVAIRNNIFALVGFDNGIIEEVNSQTVEGQPGLSSVSIRVSQFVKTEPQLQQTNTVKDTAWNLMSRYVYETLYTSTNFRFNPTKAIWLEWEHRDENNPKALTTTGRVITVPDPESTFHIYQDDPIMAKTKELLDLTSWWPARKNEEARAIFGIAEQHYTKQIFEKYGGNKRNDDDSAGEAFSYYAMALWWAQKYNLPARCYEEIGASPPAGTINAGDEMNVIQMDVFEQVKDLLRAACRVVTRHGDFYDSVWDGVRMDVLKSQNEYVTGVECYPDLQLPEHPATHDIRDTSPVFWFYGNTERARLVGDEIITPDVLQKAGRRMEQIFDDCKRMNTEEEFLKNISYNMPEINPRTWAEEIVDTARNEAFSGAKFPSEEMMGNKLTRTVDEGEDFAKKIREAVDENNLNRNKIGIKDGEVVRLGPSTTSGVNPGLEEQSIASGSCDVMKDVLRASCEAIDKTFYSLERAFPTFKIFFIEEDYLDSERMNIRNFDDFYQYNAIKDIRIVRSNKVPADLCVISIVSVSGELETISFSTDKENASDKIVEKFDPFKVDTEQENPFSKLVLMEGSKVQVRLGYSNSPDNLTTLFNGQVVEVGVSDISPDIIQLVCQSYGVELTSQPKDSEASYDTTMELLSAMICMPEVEHFGRWRFTQSFDPDEIRTQSGAFMAREDAPATFANWKELMAAKRAGALTLMEFTNDPQDDNIFAPNREDYQSRGQAIWDYARYILVGKITDWFGWTKDGMVYYPLDTTIWDVFKEMELRHPGYVALPVPYENRYTMFFGPPWHKYWARPAGIEESETWKQLWNLAREIEITSLGQRLPVPPQKMAEFMTLHKKGRASSGERYQPFRAYHLLSSRHNMIANNMAASSWGTFNAVHLHYVKKHMDKKTLEELQEKKTIMGISLGDIAWDDLKMKADDNIEDRHTRMMDQVYPTCVGDYFARRYAVGLLMRSLKDTYRGEITILGDPKVKPYDICFIYDDYRDMYGPVEVEQVTHTFSHETGFITQIRPNMIITCNQYATQCTLDAMWDVMTSIFGKMKERMGLPLTIGATAAGIAMSGGLGLILAAVGGYKIIQWTQERQPIIITPVVQGFKPFVAGLTGFINNDVYASINGKLRRFKEHLKEGWEELTDVKAQQFLVDIYKGATGA